MSREEERGGEADRTWVWGRELLFVAKSFVCLPKASGERCGLVWQLRLLRLPAISYGFHLF